MLRSLSQRRRKIAPRANRELKARMELAGLNALDVSRRLKISYARCTEIIAGTRLHPEKFARIHAFVFSAQIPAH